MKRVKKMQKQLAQYGVDALIIQHPRDLYYLTGLELSAGTLVCSKEDAMLFVDGRYEETCKKLCSVPSQRIAEGAVHAYIKKKKCQTVGFDADTTSFSAYQTLGQKGVSLVALSKPVERVRAIKDAGEIQALKRAAKLCQAGFEHVCSLLKKGISEKELAMRLQIFWLEKGAERLSFDPIIAFGANSSMPHYRAGDAILSPGDVVLIDIGVVLDGYASDMTRVVFFGKPNPRLSKIYDIVKKAKDAACQACRAGIRSEALYKVAADVIDKAGYKDAFLHGLGHGIGLDVHEYPILRAKGGALSVELEAGMCITIEPGIYIPALGGVRLEDMVLVTKEGCTMITNMPEEKIIIPSVL